MLEVAMLRLRLVLRQPATLVMMILVPVIFMSFVSLILAARSGGAVVPAVAVVDRDASPLSRDLVALLERDGRLRIVPAADPAEGEAALRAGRLAAVVVVPEGFGRRVRQGDRPELELVERRQAAAPSLVGELLRQAAQELAARAAAASAADALLAAAGSPALGWDAAYARASALWSPRPPVALDEADYRPPAAEPDAAGRARIAVAPGYVVMFVMMMTTMGASGLLAERSRRTLYRMLAAPVTRARIIAGHALGLWLMGCFQVFILLAVAVLGFDLSLGSSPAGLALVLLTFVAASTGLGMLIAAVVRTPGQAGAAGSLVVIVLSMLGGVWWPVEVMPRAMQRLAAYLPTYWAGQGILDIILRGRDAGAVLGYASYLALFAAAGLAAGGWLLARQDP